jgi:hypothetical protein
MDEKMPTVEGKPLEVKDRKKKRSFASVFFVAFLIAIKL